MKKTKKIFTSFKSDLYNFKIPLLESYEKEGWDVTDLSYQVRSRQHDNLLSSINYSLQRAGNGSLTKLLAVSNDAGYTTFFEIISIVCCNFSDSELRSLDEFSDDEVNSI